MAHLVSCRIIQSFTNEFRNLALAFTVPSACFAALCQLDEQYTAKQDEFEAVRPSALSS